VIQTIKKSDITKKKICCTVSLSLTLSPPTYIQGDEPYLIDSKGYM